MCTALEVGGLTPSLGLIQTALHKYKLETHVLIRPRAGNFCYSSDEKETMLQDIHALQQFGDIGGFVVGALNSKKEIDQEWLLEVIKIAPNSCFTFHRAIDEVVCWADAIETLIKLKFHRVLTSGQKTSVLEGVAVIQEMKKLAANRIEIMCGGGIVSEDIPLIFKNPISDAVHFSGSVKLEDQNNHLFQSNRLVVDENKIESILSALRSI